MYTFYIKKNYVVFGQIENKQRNVAVINFGTNTAI